jgi:hypothetical protein
MKTKILILLALMASPAYPNDPNWNGDPEPPTEEPETPTTPPDRPTESWADRNGDRPQSRPSSEGNWIVPVVIGALILCAIACGNDGDPAPVDPGPVCKGGC